MLVNLTATFDEGKRWFEGENPDVDPTIATRWIAEGKATADITPPQRPPWGLSTLEVKAVQLNPQNTGENPQRVLLIGDSLSLRENHPLSGANVTVSGTDATIDLGSGGIEPVIGSNVRITGQANTALNTVVPVVAIGTDTMTVRYPFDVTGLFSVTCSGCIYSLKGTTGWWNYAEAELASLGYPLGLIRNAGVGGNTLQAIYDRVSTEIAPLVRAGDVVVLMGGVNGALTTGTSLDTSTAANVIAQFKLIIDALLALDVTVCVSTITQAEASTYWATSPATALANTLAGNGYIRGRGLSSARVRVFDSWTALGAGSYASAGAVETGGIHFLPRGAELVGQRFVDDCIGAFRKGTFYRVLSVSDAYVDSTSKNLLSNPEFTGATGTTAPTGWTASLGSGTNTLTLAARADGIGNDLTIAKTHTGSNAATLSQDITARVTAGSRLVYGSEYETGTGAEGHYFSLSLEFDVGGVTQSHRLGRNTFSYAQGERQPPAGVRRFFEHYNDQNGAGRVGVTVPAGFTAVRFSYRLQLGASGSCAAVVSRPHVYAL